MAKTRDGKELIVPVVHLNGTGKDDLVRNYREAYKALTAACEALNKTAPHGRDYYVRIDGDWALREARKQHQDRAHKLIEVMDELAILAYEIQDQSR